MKTFKKKNILATLLLSCFLAACHQNGTTTPASASKVEVKKGVMSEEEVKKIQQETGLPIVPLKDIQIDNEVKKIVLDKMGEKIASGEILEENVIIYMKLQSQVKDKLIKEGSARLIEEESKAGNNVNEGIDKIFFKGEIKELDKSKLNKDELELYEKIRNSADFPKEQVIRSLTKLGTSDLYQLMLNNINVPLITNSQANYFINHAALNMDLGVYAIIDKKGNMIQDQNIIAQFYQDTLLKEIKNDLIKDNKLIKKQFGKGERKLYAFIDVDCPACLAQEDEFSKLDESANLTIYYVMNPLVSIHPNAMDKSAKILCSEKPDEVFEQYNKANLTAKKIQDLELSDSDKARWEKADKQNCLYKVQEQQKYPTLFGFNQTPILLNEKGQMFLEKALADKNSIENFVK